jgi:hypothetical protein
MKIKVILLQVIYFGLLLCLKFIFHTRCAANIERVIHIQSNMEIILELLLLLGLSFGMCKYILKSNRMMYTSLWMGLSLFFLFQVSILIEYKLGFLPNYGDVPMLIGISLNLLVMLAYVFILYLLCLFWKRIKY